MYFITCIVDWKQEIHREVFKSLVRARSNIQQCVVQGHVAKNKKDFQRRFEFLFYKLVK